VRYLVLIVVAMSALVPTLAHAEESDAPPPWMRSIVCPVLYTHEIASQAVFRRFIMGLLNAGYQPADLNTVDAAMVGSIDPPGNCVVLTFDDSLLSQYLNAAPVLEDLGVPAVFFVLPGFSDGVHRYMADAQLEDLANAGFNVELHTCNHANLPLLARRNLLAFYAELDDCRRILEDIVGEPVDYVAYPSGAYDATVLDAVARFGFRGAFTTRASAVLNFRSPYALPRIRYDPGEAVATVLRRIRAAGG
jgi:peptidoglycan/xylan/chitin deacetylase (PgdA/CDA1 family)